MVPQRLSIARTASRSPKISGRILTGIAWIAASVTVGSAAHQSGSVAREDDQRRILPQRSDGDTFGGCACHRPAGLTRYYR